MCCRTSVEFFLWRQSNHFHNVREWKVSLGAEYNLFDILPFYQIMSIFICATHLFVSHILLFVHRFFRSFFTCLCVHIHIGLVCRLFRRLSAFFRLIPRLNPCISCVITLQGLGFLVCAQTYRITGVLSYCNWHFIHTHTYIHTIHTTIIHAEVLKFSANAKKEYSADALKMHRTLCDEKYIEQFFFHSHRLFLSRSRKVQRERERKRKKWTKRSEQMRKEKRAREREREKERLSKKMSWNTYTRRSKVSGKNDDAIAKQQNRLQLVRKKMMNAAEQRKNVNWMSKQYQQQQRPQSIYRGNLGSW